MNHAVRQLVICTLKNIHQRDLFQIQDDKIYADGMRVMSALRMTQLKAIPNQQHVSFEGEGVLKLSAYPTPFAVLWNKNGWYIPSLTPWEDVFFQ